MRNPKFLLVSLLFLSLLWAPPSFARDFTLQSGLPNLPNLPSGEKTYDTGGASPDQPEELDAVSRPSDIQGGVQSDTEGVKANKWKISYGATDNRISQRIPDQPIENQEQDKQAAATKAAPENGAAPDNSQQPARQRWGSPGGLPSTGFSLKRGSFGFDYDLRKSGSK